MGQRTYSNDLRSRVEVAASMSRRKAARLYRGGRIVGNTLGRTAE
jgi:hypothetical protein